MSELPSILEQYSYLSGIKAKKPGLFYASLIRKPANFLPVLYTPGVGTACQNWGRLTSKPEGLTLALLDDAGKVEESLSKFADGRTIDVVVVTDGQRILGLGDLGANGMGISVGKTYLYSIAGGFHPKNLLPVVLDVGCADEELRSSDAYVGAPITRTTGAAYDSFVGEFHAACQNVFGKDVLIHWEDFGSSNAKRFLQRYRGMGPTFNDDIQSTAAVALASILGACRVDGVLPITKQVFMFVGAGQASLGIAALLVQALADEGVANVDARKRIWMLDSAGIVGEGRDNISPEKAPFAQGAGELRAAGMRAGAPLLQAVRSARPTCLIGAAGKAGLFTSDVLSSMSTGMLQQAGGEPLRPVVLALSNPTSKSECTFQEAWDATAGRVVFASGSPFPVVDTGEGPVYASQANNALVFPGIGAGSVLMGARTIPESSFLAAAHALADAVTDGERGQGLVVPPIARIRDAAMAVTAAVCLQSRADIVATNTGNKEVLRAAEAAAAAKGGVLDGVQGSVKVAQLQDVIEDWRF